MLELNFGTQLKVIIICLVTAVSVVILYVHSCAYYIQRLPPQILLKCVGMEGTKLLMELEVGINEKSVEKIITGSTNYPQAAQWTNIVLIR